MLARTFAIAAFAGALGGGMRGAAADPLYTDDTWRVSSRSTLAIDGGLFVGKPEGMPTGMSTGVGAGATWGDALAFGVRASWSTATELTTAYTVTQADLRVRAIGALQHAVGRGTFALRLGVGPTLVHETHLRTQGERAGLTGSALETTAFDTLPAADLEAVIGLHVAGPWMVTMSGGPSFDDLDGASHWGWIAALGVGWQP